jgi:hypothetical protein
MLSHALALSPEVDENAGKTIKMSLEAVRGINR